MAAAVPVDVRAAGLLARTCWSAGSRPSAAAATSAHELRPSTRRDVTEGRTDEVEVQSHHLQKPAYIYSPAVDDRAGASSSGEYRAAVRPAEPGRRDDMGAGAHPDPRAVGAQTTNREDFRTLVADVSLGRVGAIFALEASRLARSNLEWHRLIEICALTRTLVIDEDGCYDPAQEVQGAVRRVFEVFRQMGSAYAVVHHFGRQQRGFRSAFETLHLGPGSPSGSFRVEPPLLSRLDLMIGRAISRSVRFVRRGAADARTPQDLRYAPYMHPTRAGARPPGPERARK